MAKHGMTSPTCLDCVGTWSGYGSCSRNCGSGSRIRTYSITTYASNGGSACPYSHGRTQTQACDNGACPVNCVGSWSAYGSCSKTCGPGSETRTYSITTPASGGGSQCPYFDGNTQNRICNNGSCVPSMMPSKMPTSDPSLNPTAEPSLAPTNECSIFGENFNGNEDSCRATGCLWNR